MKAVAFLLAALLVPAVAAPPAGSRSEQQRIDHERVDVLQRHAERERECRRRFVVTACLDAARAERRLAIEHLDEQQRVLDDTERKRRAADRLARIREKMDQPPTPAKVRATQR